MIFCALMFCRVLHLKSVSVLTLALAHPVVKPFINRHSRCLSTCSITAVLAGVLRGTGRQKIGVMTSALAFWVVGLPLGAVLDLHVGLGIMGLW